MYKNFIVNIRKKILIKVFYIKLVYQGSNKSMCNIVSKTGKFTISCINHDANTRYYIEMYIGFLHTFNYIHTSFQLHSLTRESHYKDNAITRRVIVLRHASQSNFLKKMT